MYFIREWVGGAAKQVSFVSMARLLRHEELFIVTPRRCSSTPEKNYENFLYKQLFERILLYDYIIDKSLEIMMLL